MNCVARTWGRRRGLSQVPTHGAKLQINAHNAQPSPPPFHPAIIFGVCHKEAAADLKHHARCKFFFFVRCSFSQRTVA